MISGPTASPGEVKTAGNRAGLILLANQLLVDEIEKGEELQRLLTGSIPENSPPVADETM